MIFSFPEAEVLRVIDGDTLKLRVDTGFGNTHTGRFRLRGYDAPEPAGESLALGAKARAFLRDLLPAGVIVGVTTHAQDSFGRWLCDVHFGVGREDLASYLIGKGWGRPWDGQGERPRWDPTKPYPLRGG